MKNFPIASSKEIFALANSRYFLDAVEDYASIDTGFERGNYATDADYAKDLRKATRHLSEVRTLARLARESGNGYTINVYLADYLLSLRYRLEMAKTTGNVWYCAGQYFPIEYRAACAEAIMHAIRAAYIGKVGDRKDWREALRVSLVPHFGQKYAKKIANR